MNHRISTVVIALLAVAFCFSGATAYYVVDKTPPEEGSFTAGNTVRAGLFLGFAQDFEANQSLVYSTELENPRWNQSIYIISPVFFDAEWYLQPESAGPTLAVPNIRNQTHLIDAVYIEVEGTVPQKANGTPVSVIQGSLVDTGGAVVPGTSEEIVQEIGALQPSTPKPTQPVPVTSKPQTLPVSTPTPKSPVGTVIPLAAFALGALAVALHKRP